MKVDARLPQGLPPAAVARAARDFEDAGYDGLWTRESSHDPFVPLGIAAEHTASLRLGTSIAVAFARSPMNLAYLGNDLAFYSGGRFALGLGSQVRAHVERRYSMPWSAPARRMAELVSAIREIWRCWETGARLSFEGDFYRHTLMTPAFTPEPHPHGPPPILLAAVGERMTEVAGEVADGLLVHGFTTPRYLREVTLPTLERGLAASGRARTAVEVSAPVLLATGATEEAMAESVHAVRKQIAFYGSTPAYRPVLERHGWGELAGELHRLSRARQWDAMTALVDDDVLHAFAVVAEPERTAAEVMRRMDGLADRISFYTVADTDPAVPALAARALAAGPGL
ncbi:TIGR03617 family F420-dependent LLM class oxidoreductase [Actinomadura darangshiensis]|uniref:TIGR03617 family F420-dependent LLM class oxidoreductase n=1 Tax=Actinomadura darangshiensis TaxID=705336 RepID=A0A4R5C0C1_9ACTN|nr:TIGR03617 family F420-dependent LLM class oxidoreductase [Actinomadura darangshiensis]TDD92135.1 TIGR03617 family F420-dependent LLM class oxidoreductase [Actinomadura darangshiensis]